MRAFKMNSNNSFYRIFVPSRKKNWIKRNYKWKISGRKNKLKEPKILPKVRLKKK